MKSILYVPYIKIRSPLVEQLCRAPVYLPYLLTYEEQLDAHITAHGDVDNSVGLPFTIHDVHNKLETRNVPAIPPTLNDNIRRNEQSPTPLTTSSSTMNHSSLSNNLKPSNMSPDDNALIASSEPLARRRF